MEAKVQCQCDKWLGTYFGEHFKQDRLFCTCGKVIVVQKPQILNREDVEE